MINQFLKNIINKKKKNRALFFFFDPLPRNSFCSKNYIREKNGEDKKDRSSIFIFLEFLFGHVTGACDVGGSEAAGSGEHMGRFGGPHGPALGPGATHVAWRWKVLLRL